MAVTATLVTPEERHTPFTGGTDRDRLLRGAARGETIFFKNDIWAAAGAGNERSINFICDLPNSWAWVLTDASVTFLNSASAYILMEAVGMMELSLPSPGGTEYIYGQYESLAGRQDANSNTAIGSIQAREYNTQWPVVTATSAMTFELNKMPNYMLYPWNQVSSDQVRVSNIFSEPYQNYGSYSYRFAARFLQYDLDQVYDYRVQSPSLTR